MKPTGQPSVAAELVSSTSLARGGDSPSVVYKSANWFEPLDWQRVFERSQPIEIDLGCGKGSFLLWAATTYPTRNFLGVERLLRRVRSVDRKAARGGLTNLRLVRLEATYLVSKLIPDKSVSTYHILFPDPWPKRRHHGHRLISPGFLVDLHRTMTADSAVNCATDHGEYFEWIQRAFEGSGWFTEAEPVVLPPEAQTDFEKKFVAAGKPVHRCRWLKR
jgi:tRNA (guanine-N7-)-methyltransferase